MGKIIDGKKISNSWKEEIKRKLESIETTPYLATVLIDSSYSSKLYTRIKQKSCEELQINNEIFNFTNESDKEIVNFIKYLNWDHEVDGILVQLPLPERFDSESIVQSVDPLKDVDGLNYSNLGKCFASDNPLFIPATPLGIMRIFSYYNLSLESKNVVILGRSNIVGKPLSALLLRKNSTITICHSKTRNMTDITKQADILISAIGKPNFVDSGMVKHGSIIIDVGISRTDDGRITGDVNFNEVKEKSSYITPVPGGVGPLTVTGLMENVTMAHLLKRGSR